VWLGHVNHLNFGGHQTNHISGTAAATVRKFCTLIRLH